MVRKDATAAISSSTGPAAGADDELTRRYAPRPRKYGSTPAAISQRLRWLRRCRSRSRSYPTPPLAKRTYGAPKRAGFPGRHNVSNNPASPLAARAGTSCGPRRDSITTTTARRIAPHRSMPVPAAARSCRRRSCPVAGSSGAETASAPWGSGRCRDDRVTSRATQTQQLAKTARTASASCRSSPGPRH